MYRIQEMVSKLAWAVMIDRCYAVDGWIRFSPLASSSEQALKLKVIGAWRCMIVKGKLLRYCLAP